MYVLCVYTYVKRSEFLRFIKFHTEEHSAPRSREPADDPLRKRDAEPPFELVHSVIAIQTVYNSTRYSGDVFVGYLYVKKGVGEKRIRGSREYVYVYIHMILAVLTFVFSFFFLRSLSPRTRFL